MKEDIGARLILLIIATVIAFLICTIFYCILFSQNGLVTTFARTKDLLEISYKTEELALLECEEYIDNFMPDKQYNTLYLSHVSEEN